MTEHILKTIDHYWYAVESGEKTFEVRRDDRGFQKGDVLVLRRLRPDSGNTDYDYDAQDNLCHFDLRRRVTYVLTGGQFGIEPGYVVLGLGEP